MISEWRGFDMRSRISKLEHAFQRLPVRSPDDVPIMVHTPCYFAFGTPDKPVDYFSSPANMVTYQENSAERHLKNVHDDYVPYFMPWFGTGVLASAYGCPIKMPDQPIDDPAVSAPCLHHPSDVAHLKLPDAYKDGWMPRVLAAIDYARSHSDLPIGLTDMQGPLDTIGLMCGQAQLYQWLYNEKQAMHDLFDLVTEAFIQWVKVQKEHNGESLDSSNGLQGICSPGLGVWESDDDMVLLDSGLYQEFVTPCVSRIFEAFGGGHIHFCGNGTQHVESLLAMHQLKAVNNSPLGNFKAFAELRQRLGGKVALEIQDGAPDTVETYYPRLFAGIDNFDGIILTPFVIDNVAMDDKGGYIPTTRDPLEAANRITQVVRECVRKKLAGEPLITEEERHHFYIADETIKLQQKPAETTADPHRASLDRVQECLMAFDSSGLQDAVHAALDLGLEPFAIITGGMAEGMARVGRLFEEGEYFLPQLVMAGATMQKGMDILKPLLAAGKGQKSKGKVVIGTVKGDMHDIGKNLVITMLAGAGFEVIDLGVDVPPERFVAAARDQSVDIVAMSALLTTTAPNMHTTIEALQAAGLRSQVKVMIGGAPLSRSYADQIGAEGYSSDAVGAVAEAERLLK